MDRAPILVNLTPQRVSSSPEQFLSHYGILSSISTPPVHISVNYYAGSAVAVLLLNHLQPFGRFAIITAVCSALMTHALFSLIHPILLSSHSLGEGPLAFSVQMFFFALIELNFDTLVVLTVLMKFDDLVVLAIYC